MKGERYGRLLCIEDRLYQSPDKKHWYGLFRCDCGAEVQRRLHHIRGGRVKSCGCFCQESRIKHGKHLSKVYQCWKSMRSRCEREKDIGYARYGGRGITVCGRWQDFENFYADMGDPPAGTSLDRINNDGNYEPGNCRWATKKQQQRNMRSNTRFEWNGELVTLIELAERFSIDKRTLGSRLRKGWSLEDALLTPIRGHDVVG